MTRNGKIARVPHSIREQLNCRLQDGEPGKDLVVWLNSLPEVQQVLTDEFRGRPISEQNLSEWKQGGYRDWERHEESCTRLRELTRQSDNLAEEADGVEISHRLAAVLAMELARVFEELLDQTTDPQKRWHLLREMLREVAQLRQEDRKEGWLALERHRREEDEHERRRVELKEQVCAPFWAKLELGPLAEILGGGEAGRKVAAFILEMTRDLPRGTLSGKFGPESIKPDQTESNPIKPDQTGTAPPPAEQIA